METSKVIETLNNLTIGNKLNDKEKEAVDDSLKYLESLRHKEGERYDFQEKLIETLTMKQLRKFVRDNGALDDNAKILVLQDDGMGYGANNGYCSSLYASENKNGKKEVQIWF